MIMFVLCGTIVWARVPAPSPAVAYFKLAFPPYADIFIIKLTNPETIQQARDVLAAGGSENSPIVVGIIVKAPVHYNPGWSYQLDPATIVLADAAIEVCDAAPAYVEEHLDEVGGAFLPESVWCPWSSQLMAEVQPAQIFHFLPLVQT